MVPNSHSVIARGEGWGNTNAIGHEKTLCVCVQIQLAGFAKVYFILFLASKEPDVSLGHDRVNIGFKFISWAET